MKNKRVLMIVLSVLLVVGMFVALFSVSAEYSDSDPLVTLSYINETVIPKIKDEIKSALLLVIDEKIAAIEIPELPEEPEAPAEPETKPEPEAPAEPTPPVEPLAPTEPEVKKEDLDPLKYSVVHLVQGETLLASGSDSESCEIVLRAGSVYAVSPFENQGLADLTASVELLNNAPLTVNNYCIIPRGGDGRGITAVDSDAYILVRGEYKIVQ